MTEKTLSLSRRLFLRSSLAAGAAVTVTATPIVVEAVAAENAELLAIEASLADIEASCIAANAERLAARARFDAIAPKLPKCLVHDRRTALHPDMYWCGENERDVEHHAVYSADGSWSIRRIYESYLLEIKFPFLKEAPGEAEAKVRDMLAVELRRLHGACLRYERAFNRARKRSGIAAALEGMSEAFSAAYKCADRAAEAPARSWRGIAIKARAFEISRQWDHDGPRRDSLSRANHLAGSVLLPEILALANGGKAVAS